MEAPPPGRKTTSRFDRPATRPGRPPERPPQEPRDPNSGPRDDRSRPPPSRPRADGPRPPAGRPYGQQSPNLSGDPNARHRPQRDAAGYDRPSGNRGPSGAEHRGPPPDLVTGIHSVLGLLQGAPHRVREVLLWSREPRLVAQVRTAADAAKIPVVEESQPAFDSDPANPQGVAVRVSEFAYADLDTVVPEDGCETGTLILVLDSITDPRNLGAILRSAAFFGVQAVILPQDRAAGITPVVERVSRAATATVPVVRVVNLARTLEIIKERGVFVVGTGLEPGCDDLATFRFARATAIVLGAEGSGLRPLIRKKCDTLVKLGGSEAMQSLNVSAFATLALHIARAQLPAPTAS